MPQNLDNFGKLHRLKKDKMLLPSDKASTLEKIRLGLKIRHILKDMSLTSWKSKVGGILVALGTSLPAMLPDQWDWIGAACGTIGGLLLAGGRDNNVSSQEVGIRK